MITFFAFFLIILKLKVFDKVSIVFPDLEIIINKTLLMFSLFLNELILFSLISLKK